MDSAISVFVCLFVSDTNILKACLSNFVSYDQTAPAIYSGLTLFATEYMYMYISRIVMARLGMFLIPLPIQDQL